MSTELAGSTALVTGSTSGIGQAIAETLAGLGAHVIVSGRHLGRGEQVVGEIRAAGGEADFVAADLSGLDGVRSLAGQAIAVTGQVDILVNNAGIFYSGGPTAETTEAEFDAHYDVNVKAPYFLVGILAPHMAARGGGVIVNLATGAAHKGFAGVALYGSTKAALLLLTKSWSAEYGPSGVRVNAISPGPVHTPGTAVLGEGINVFAEGTPAGRVAEPHEIASVVAFLVSGKASYIHGVTLPVDGGAAAV
ncbi:SDR family NAD(P)-dependent oxidoreductase [Amycolatopsis sp. H20-H5]|uniref:SDR family NAD(P)-dependent oxidoreductase n=1 Tax=Amycolatopsis sp. H20-H5 TaxID=3046309 RepID=UPI002DB5B150|nr:glucose 1-dehydrogenase [Amycolatopsis sp. H20-H5]MEC3975234.1 glucose 1-dehydrogenase [Amycolatopsis sp. H20-H5]